MNPEPGHGTRDWRRVDAVSWMSDHGWEAVGRLHGVASLWQKGSEEVIVPGPSAADYRLRWEELVATLARVADIEPAALSLEISNEGADIAEWCASSELTIDGTVPLAGGEALISAARQAVVAAANSAIQPRGYFGHSQPKLARTHARLVRMGQTRPGSYVVPIISRLPEFSLMDGDEQMLFAHGEQPFERTAMVKLARALDAIESMAINQDSEPSMRQLNESVARGVSHEMCAALAHAMRSDVLDEIDVSFSWARRWAPSNNLPRVARFPAAAVDIVERMAERLRGSEVVAEQTIRGFVRSLRRGEDDEFGAVALTTVLNTLSGVQRRQVHMDLDDSQYDLASDAHVHRFPVFVRGQLVRAAGRAWRLERVSDFGLAEPQLPDVHVRADIAEALPREVPSNRERRGELPGGSGE